MNFDQLEMITEVARTGTVSEAAAQLHLSAAAISRAITRLEQELGVQLFVRSRTGAALTEEGRRIVRLAERILGEAEELLAEAGRCQKLVNAKVRISTVPAPTWLLVHALLELREDIPSLELEIGEKGTQEVIEDIRQGKADIGLIVSEADAKYPDIRLEKIADGQMALGVGREHPLVSRASVTMKDLEQLPLVIYPDKHLEAIIAALGPAAKVLFRTNNRDALLLAVRRNMAATLGTDYSFRGIQEEAGSDIIAVPLSIQTDSDLSLWLVRPRDRKPSQAVRLLAGRLRRLLKKRMQE